MIISNLFFVLSLSLVLAFEVDVVKNEKNGEKFAKMLQLDENLTTKRQFISKLGLIAQQNNF